MSTLLSLPLTHNAGHPIGPICSFSIVSILNRNKRPKRFKRTSMHQDGGVFQRISNAEATESETRSCGISVRSFLIARASGTVPKCKCKCHLDSAWFFLFTVIARTCHLFDFWICCTNIRRLGDSRFMNCFQRPWIGTRNK